MLKPFANQKISSTFATQKVSFLITKLNNNDMKRLFLLLFTIICTAVCLAQERFTIGDLTYKVKNNAEVKVYKCNKSATEVDIPTSVRYKLRKYDVTSIGFGAFENCTNLLSVAIPNSINEIEACAFSYCSALNSIKIPNSFQLSKHIPSKRVLH